MKGAFLFVVALVSFTLLRTTGILEVVVYTFKFFEGTGYHAYFAPYACTMIMIQNYFLSIT